MDKIRKFVSWDVQPLDNLRECTVYKVYEKVAKGEKLTRDEKNYITSKVNTNCHFRDGIALLGWRFPFSKVLHTFIVKQYGTWQEYRAVDKTSLRAHIYGRIEKIVKLN